MYIYERKIEQFAELMHSKKIYIGEAAQSGAALGAV